MTEHYAPWEAVKLLERIAAALERLVTILEQSAQSKNPPE